MIGYCSKHILPMFTNSHRFTNSPTFSHFQNYELCLPKQSRLHHYLKSIFTLVGNNTTKGFWAFYMYVYILHCMLELQDVMGKSQLKLCFESPFNYTGQMLNVKKERLHIAICQISLSISPCWKLTYIVLILYYYA